MIWDYDINRNEKEIQKTYNSFLNSNDFEKVVYTTADQILAYALYIGIPEEAINIVLQQAKTVNKYKFRLKYMYTYKNTFKKCFKCNNGGGKLTVHHLKPIRDYPYLKFNPNNLIVLCENCHNEIHKVGNHKERLDNKMEELKGIQQHRNVVLNKMGY